MSWLASLVLDWVWGKLTSLISFFVSREIKREEIKKGAEASVEPLKQAESGDDIDKAAKDALDGF